MNLLMMKMIRYFLPKQEQVKQVSAMMNMEE